VGRILPIGLDERPVIRNEICNACLLARARPLYPGLIGPHEGHFSIDAAFFTGIDNGLKVGSAP
jgi:hypothetical protein